MSLLLQSAWDTEHVHVTFGILLLKYGDLQFMETLALHDLYSLNQSIQILYTLHNLDTFGVDALTIVDRLVPSELPNFFQNHVHSPQFSTIFLHDDDWFTPELKRVATQYYYEHPIVKNMPQTLTGASKISDYISVQELYCLEGLYQQYLGVFGIEEQMTLFLPQLNDVNVVGFSLQRSERNFIERDRLILNLLRPHLFQAYTNAQQHQQLQQKLSRNQQSLDDLGVIVLDTEGRVISIPPQVILWLERYFVKSTCCSQLPDHLWAWVKHQVASLTTKTDPSPTCLPLRIQQAGRELTIRLTIKSDGARYLLLIEEQTLSSLDSLVLLGLTQRETQVLALLIQGKDNKMIALQIDITIGTVRKHLENIYLKLGVQSRTEAIAYTFQKLGLVHSLSIE